MDNPNPYRAPSSVPVGAKPARRIRVLAVVGYGLALFVAGVAVGALTPPGSLLVDFMLSFVAQATVFTLLAYRQAGLVVTHALLAICFEWALGWAANSVLQHYIPTPAEPVVLSVVGWAVTFVAFAVGVTIGSLLRRRREGGA
ncbi:hypothetical protein GCM10027188_29640 [Lysobacter humi (ex Lee et al. 2017)]